MNIELGKTYLTRNGLRVTITFDHGQGICPLTGPIEGKLGAEIGSWSRLGEFIPGGAGSHLDLVGEACKLPTPLKVFVWRDVFSDFDPGLAVAVAETPQQARELIARGSEGKQSAPVPGESQAACDARHALYVVRHWEHAMKELAGEPEIHEAPYGTR